MSKRLKLFELLKKESETLFSDSHNVFTPLALTNNVLSKIDVKNKTILVMYNVEFVITLIEVYSADPEQIVFYSDHKNKSKLVERFGVKYIEELSNMKFDLVIGNPPYQDGSQDGGQNKIYNQICKKALTLIEDDGVLAFVTPTSVLKKSKRFSLLDQPGLKTVDFTADDYFNVGINICSWIVDKQHTGDVEVIHANGTDMQSNSQVIYDYSKVNRSFADLYARIKGVADTPDKRMFKQNNFGPAMSKSKDARHVYPLHKISNGTAVVTFYSSRVPYFVGKNKFTISMTKGFSNDAIVVGVDDYDVAHMTTEVNSTQEVENIKSFIFSDYFKEHSQRWKDLDGYGYNYALKYLPPFDKTKSWTSDEVKSFLEGFLNGSV
jgi:hypothetical protein